MIELKLYKPNYFLMPINDSLLSEYALGFSLAGIFKVRGHSIKTAADELVINTKLDKLKENIKIHLESEDSPFQGVKLNQKEKDFSGAYKILPYRVFDNRYYYDSKMTDVRCQTLTKHESIESNYYLGFTPYVRDNNDFKHIVITKNTLEVAFFTGKANTHCAPLYIYNDQNKIESIEDNYYLGFTASVIENCNYSHTIITKFTPDVNFFKGKGKLHSAPLYIKENSND